ncbi:hypothetical protein HQ544_02020, partial [Candidatus Falkowbacteria bacterium]|nr:hypothetical protein [Candidatus Falkowbacteria bacterium]
GNVGLAREYLKTIEEDSRLLAGAYDHSYNIIFTRAVVTQNRILSEVEGVPTTFEFKGLTIDGTIFVSDYSNRDNWEEFRRDFHLLAGLNASFYEAEIFEEIAGLESISTVRGLQYAYARPDEYTVHIIDASNSGEIDGLDLSENTKANMRAEVALGKEIITPDKFVETGNWRGLFYISLAEDGTAQYAIGEQVLSNGGWTTSELLQYIYVDEDEKGRQGFLRQFEEESFYYEDSKSVKSDEVMCRITDAEYNAVTGGSDWSSTFGYPCNIGSVSFGEVDHAYIQASNAAHFYREGWYDYWTTTSRIKQKINSYIAEKKSLDSEDLNYLKSGNTYTFRFSPTLGTYVQSICEDKPILTFWFLKKCTTLGTVYYSPAGTDGNIYRTRGEILSKLDKDNQVIIKKIGFPVSDETLGGESELVRGVNNGRYQSFINGEVFGYDPYFIPLFSDRSPKVLNSVFYTYGLITEVHKLMGRTEGELGYPLNDARQGTDGDIYQTYEGKKEIKYDTTTRLVGVVNLKEYRCELYGHFDGNTSALSLIQISGFLEGLGSEISDDIEFSTRLAGQIGRGLIHLDETMIEFDRILSKTTNQDIWNKVKGAYGAAAVKMQEVKNEYDQATEPDGCDARIIYYHGKLIGVATAYIIPAEELFALAKARAIARPKLVSDFLEEAGGTMGKFGKEMRFVNTVDRNQWRYIKTILDSNEKGRKAEELMQRMLGGEKTPFLSGDRIVDLWVENKKFANEIKTQARNVSYTGLTKDQINADIRLMNSADEFHPMWHFLRILPLAL